MLQAYQNRKIVLTTLSARKRLQRHSNDKVSTLYLSYIKTGLQTANKSVLGVFLIYKVRAPTTL